MMSDPKTEMLDFKAKRRAGIIAIAVSMPVTILCWLALTYLLPPLANMDGFSQRMTFALKCCCVAVLFCLDRHRGCSPCEAVFSRIRSSHRLQHVSFAGR